MHSHHPQRTLLAFVCAALFISTSYAQTTQKISLNSLGAEATKTSFMPSISSDGILVAFASEANNLMSGDTNGTTDIFVRNTQTGVTQRVSIDSLGVQANGFCSNPSLSADGRFVAFRSEANNLVAGTSIAHAGIYVHDRNSGTTEIISVDSSGGAANGDSGHPSISANGLYVAFYSAADNLVFGDSNQQFDVFVRDRQNNITTRVSVDSNGNQGNGFSSLPAISDDGQHISFESSANNLVLGDTNGINDIFVHSRQSGLTERVSVDSNGSQGNGGFIYPSSISGDGRFVAFGSFSDNLVAYDTNQVDDIFRHDRQTGETVRASDSQWQYQSSYPCRAPAISADGNFISFYSFDHGFIPGAQRGSINLLIRNVAADAIRAVSVNDVGVVANDDCFVSSISADGRYVAFESFATNLLLNGSNTHQSVFIHDQWNGFGQNSIYLNTPYYSQAGSRISLSWENAPPNSAYWIAASWSDSGTIISGHSFDLGTPYNVFTSGANQVSGSGSYLTSPVPSTWVDRTLYLELVAVDSNGILFDSNIEPVLLH